MPQVSPASTPRVTVQVPVPTPVQAPPKKPKAQAQPQAQPQAAPPQQPAYPPPPWVRPQEPEFSPRQFVEAHSLILPFAPPPKPRFRPPAGLKFGRRRYNRAFAAGIAQAGEDEMPSLAFADWLAENGHSGAEEVVRRGLEHRRHLRDTDHRLILFLSYPGAVDVWPEHWIREDAVQAMDQHPHGMRAWAYPVNSEQRGHWQVAFSVLSHPTAVRYPDDSRSGGRGEPVPGRHVVQYHTGPVPAADAHRLLGTMAHEGVPGAGEGWRQVLQAHPDLARPERMSRPGSPRRYSLASEADFHRTIVGEPNVDLHHLIYADHLDEQNKPAHAEVIRRAVHARRSDPTRGEVEASPDIGVWNTTPPGHAVTYQGMHGVYLIFRPHSHPEGRIHYWLRTDSPDETMRLHAGLEAEGANAFDFVTGRRRMSRPVRYALVPGRWSRPFRWDYESLNAALGNRDQRRVGATRHIARTDDGIALVLHRTPVVTFHPDGTHTVRTGGYHTSTTRDTLNSVLGRSRFHIRGGRLHHAGGPLAEGQQFHPDGSPAGGPRIGDDDYYAWSQSIQDNPSRAPIFADYLEEHGYHADDFTLDQLRHPEAASHHIYMTPTGRVHARVTNYRPPPEPEPERMTRKLTRREKIARRRGRLIKREVASGRHPDRQTAVLAALALSIKADEA